MNGSKSYSKLRDGFKAVSVFLPSRNNLKLSQLRRRSVHTARLVGLAQLLSRVVIKSQFRVACLTLVFGTCFLFTVPLRLAFVPHYTYGDRGSAGFTLLDCACDAFFLVQLARAVHVFVLRLAAKRTAKRAERLDLARAGWQEQSAADSNAVTSVTVVSDSPLGVTQQAKHSVPARRNSIWTASTQPFVWAAHEGKSQLLKGYQSPELRHCLKLILNIAATLPIELFAYAAGYRNLAVWQVNRLLRVITLPHTARTAARFLEQRGQFTNAMTRRAWRFGFMSALICHWVACALFALALHDDAFTTWLTKDGLATAVTDPATVIQPLVTGSGVTTTIVGEDSVRYALQRSVPQTYNRALYWAVSVVGTTGLGDIVPHSAHETLAIMLVFVISITLTLAAVANLTLLITAADPTSGEHVVKVEAAHRYMRYRQLPTALRTRITAYLDYRWQQLHGVNETAFLDGLPPSLRRRTVDALVGDALRSLPLLNGCQRSLIAALASHVEAHVFGPHDDVITPGEHIVSVLMLRRGTLVSYNSNCESVTVMLPGSSFGSECLTHSLLPVSSGSTTVFSNGSSSRSIDEEDSSAGEPLICNVRVSARTFCEALTLTAQAFVSVLADRSLSIESLIASSSSSSNNNGSNSGATAPCSPVHTTVTVHETAAGKTASHVTAPDVIDSDAISDFDSSITKNTSSSSNSTIIRSDTTAHAAVVVVVNRADDLQSLAGTDVGTDTGKLTDLNGTTDGNDVATASAATLEAIAQLTGFKRLCAPGSSFRRGWDVAVFFALLYTYVSTPLHLASCLQHTTFQDQAWRLAPDYCLDALLLCDLILESQYFARLKRGLLITEPAEIFIEFKKDRWLPLELLAAAPLDLLALFIGVKYLSLLRVFKLARLKHLLTYSERAQAALMKHSVNAPNVRQFLTLYIALGITCHWVGCMWLLAADVGIAWGEGVGWVAVDESPLYRPYQSVDHEGLGGFVGYMRSIYFALTTMSTLGYGDIAATNAVETVVATFIMFFGALLVPAIIGALGVVMSRFHATRPITAFRAKMHDLRRSMEKQDYPPELREKVLRYYDYRWYRTHGIDESEVLQDIPDHLCRKVAQCVNGKVVQELPFLNFKHLNMHHDYSRLIELLAVKFVPRSFIDGDHIVTAGEVGNDMYILEHGIAAVTTTVTTTSSSTSSSTTTSSGGVTAVTNKLLLSTVVATMSTGDYCGESALLAPRCTTINARSVTAVSYCDAFALSASDFAEVAALDEEWCQHVTEAIQTGLEAQRSSDTAVLRNLAQRIKLQRVMPLCTDVATGESTTSNTAVNSVNVVKAIHRSIHPESTFRYLWDMLKLTLIVYHLACLPWGFAFLPELGSGFYISQWLADCFFFADMYLHATRFAYVRAGILHASRGAIRARYFDRAGGLKFDIAAAVPLDILAIVLLARTPGLHQRRLLALLRLTKMIRAKKMLRLAATVSRTLQKLFGASPVPVRIAQLVGVVLLVSHWAACAFCALADRAHDWSKCDNIPQGIDRMRCKWSGTWVRQQVEQMGVLPLDGGTEAERYIRAFNFAHPSIASCTITDVYPTSFPETLFASAIILLGCAVSGAVLGAARSMMSSLENRHAETAAAADALHLHMHRLGAPAGLRNAVQDYLDCVYFRHGGSLSAQQASFDDLPRSLRIKVCSLAQTRLLKQCALFESCSDSVVRDIALHMQLEAYAQDDIIAQQHEVADDMFFIDVGSVLVLTEDRVHTLTHHHETPSEVTANEDINPEVGDDDVDPNVVDDEASDTPVVLTVGDYFGEDAIICPDERAATYKAAEFSEVYRLKRSDVLAAFRSSNSHSHSNSNSSSGSGNSSKGDATNTHQQQQLASLEQALKRHREAQAAIRVHASTRQSQSYMGSGKLSRRISAANFNFNSSSHKQHVEHSHRLDDNGDSVLGTDDSSSSSSSRRARARRASAATLKATSAKLRHVTSTVTKTVTTTVTSAVTAAVEEAPRFMPESRSRIAWESMSLACVLYIAISVPFRVAFGSWGSSVHGAQGWTHADFIVPDVLCDCFFIADVLLRLAIFPVVTGRGGGDILTDSRLIAREYYASGELARDCITAIPFAILSIGFTSGARVVLALRMSRVFRLSRFLEHVESVERYFMLYWRWRASVSARLVPKMLALFALCAHWWACANFAIHRYSEYHVSNTWAITAGLSQFDPEVGHHDVCSHSIAFCYLRSLYYVLTIMTTVGFGDMYPVTPRETVWMQFVIQSAVMLIGGIAAAFMGVFTEMDGRGEPAFKAEMSALSRYMHQRRLPPDLYSAVLLQRHHQWRQARVLNEKKLLSLLSPALRMDLAVLTRQSVLLKCPAVQCGVNEITQRYLCTQLEQQVCLGDWTVYQPGDIVQDIYFISSGAITVIPATQLLQDAAAANDTDDSYSDDGYKRNGSSVRDATDAVAAAPAAVITLSTAKYEALGEVFTAGSHFSEWSLALPGAVAIDSATSVSTCQLYSLSVSAFTEALQHMPQAERAPLITALLCSNGGQQFYQGARCHVEPHVDNSAGLWSVTLLEADVEVEVATTNSDVPNRVPFSHNGHNRSGASSRGSGSLSSGGSSGGHYRHSSKQQQQQQRQQRQRSGAASRHSFTGMGGSSTAHSTASSRVTAAAAATANNVTAATVGNIDDDDEWEMRNGTEPWAALHRRASGYDADQYRTFL